MNNVDTRTEEQPYEQTDEQAEESVADSPSPATLAEFCRNMSDEKIPQCLAAGKGKYIDPAAVPLCHSIDAEHPDHRILCLEAIAGKAYGADILEVCNGIESVENMIECLRSSGDDRDNSTTGEGEGAEEEYVDTAGRDEGHEESGPVSGSKTLTINDCTFTDEPGGMLGRICRKGGYSCGYPESGYTCYMAGEVSTGICVPSDQLEDCNR